MADLETESGPVGTDQNVVSDGIIVGDVHSRCHAHCNI